MLDPVQNFIFLADRTTNMATIGSSCDWPIKTNWPT
jgi:hypothetical protein